MRYRNPVILFLSILIIFVAVGTLLIPSKSNAQSGSVFTVKLYSGDKLVAQWDNAGVGRVEGTTYVFPVMPVNREVRISGTYSVEAAR